MEGRYPEAIMLTLATCREPDRILESWVCNVPMAPPAIHRTVPVLLGSLRDRADNADDAGVVEHHVEPSESVHGRVDARSHVGLDSHVAADANGRGTQFLSQRRGRRSARSPTLKCRQERR